MAGNYRKRRVGLPVHHCEADSDWIESQLLKISVANQITAQTKYSEIYQRIFNETPIEYQKQNKARRASNTLLRKFITKCRQAQDKQQQRAAQEQINHKTETKQYESQFTGF